MAPQLTDAESEALRRALQAYLPQLRYEAARIKLASERYELVEMEEVLTRLVARLEAEAGQGSEMAAPGI